MENVTVIAHIHTDFPEKFGIPRQSGLVPEAKGRISFEKKYQNPDYIKGIEDFSHLWLLWEFEDVGRNSESPLVRPPRLGGNETRGVFATRSPFRPNPIGLSVVKLESVEYTKDGPVLCVSGVDLRDNTPILDIKPYLAYADAHPDASDGFAGKMLSQNLEVVFDESLLSMLPKEKRDAAIGILREDPRPHYHNDPSRKYGVAFCNYDIHFTVENDILTVYEVKERTNESGKISGNPPHNQ